MKKHTILLAFSLLVFSSSCYHSKAFVHALIGTWKTQEIGNEVTFVFYEGGNLQVAEDGGSKEGTWLTPTYSILEVWVNGEKRSYQYEINNISKQLQLIRYGEGRQDEITYFFKQ